MPNCSGCGAEGTRIRSRWDDKGNRLPDECPRCDPESFNKFQAPSEKKIWPRWETHPREYEKRYDLEGAFYIHKPEYVAETEAVVSREATDEREKREAAEARKRANRNLQPMTDADMRQAMNRAAEIVQRMSNA